jgi:predicted transcriptional regulator
MAFQREAVLEHPVRGRLYEAVARQPGITIRDAAERAGVARTTAAYHLHVLVRAGLLMTRPGNKTVHCYRNDGRLTEEQQRRLQALASKRTRRVAELLASKQGMQRSELAQALGISIATVNWHLRPLAEQGLLKEERWGRRRMLLPTPALMESLATISLPASANPAGMPPAAGTVPRGAVGPVE